MLSAMLLVVPLEWLAAFAVAAAVHEFCHFAAIRIVTGKASKLRLFSNGAKIKLPQMSAGREAFCALSGPIGGLLLLPLAEHIPRIAICAGIQSVYNLIPVYPLDGGRALRCATAMLLPPNVAAALCRGVEMFCVCGLFLLAVYGCIFLNLGMFPLLLALLMLIRVK